MCHSGVKDDWAREAYHMEVPCHVASEDTRIARSPLEMSFDEKKFSTSSLKGAITKASRQPPVDGEPFQRVALDST